MSYTIIIPARYASTRFPGKPLAMLGGKPVLQHVHACAMASDAARVIVATDDVRISEAATGFGATVCMTSAEHNSGTERLAEVVGQLSINGATVIVNLQADEPFMAVSNLNQVAGLLLRSPACDMSTLCHVIEDADGVADPNCVKVVMDRRGNALYFSRAPVPWDRDGAGGMPYYRHIGLYAYTAKFIKEYVSLPACELETTEALEQLRALYYGRKIRVGISEEKAVTGIDTPEDLAKAEQLLSRAER